MFIEHQEKARKNSLLEKDIKWIFQLELVFASFPRQRAINLKRSPNLLKLQSISILAVCSPRNLCLLIELF